MVRRHTGQLLVGPSLAARFDGKAARHGRRLRVFIRQRMIPARSTVIVLVRQFGEQICCGRGIRSPLLRRRDEEEIHVRLGPCRHIHDRVHIAAVSQDDAVEVIILCQDGRHRGRNRLICRAGRSREVCWRFYRKVRTLLGQHQCITRSRCRHDSILIGRDQRLESCGNDGRLAAVVLIFIRLFRDVAICVFRLDDQRVGAACQHVRHIDVHRIAGNAPHLHSRRPRRLREAGRDRLVDWLTHIKAIVQHLIHIRVGRDAGQAVRMSTDNQDRAEAELGDARRIQRDLDVYDAIDIRHLHSLLNQRYRPPGRYQYSILFHRACPHRRAAMRLRPI